MVKLSSPSVRHMAALLAGLLVAPCVSAHWLHDGVLGTPSTSVDILQYSCALTYLGAALTGFEARVRDKLPVAAPLVRVQVQRVSPLASGPVRTDPLSNTPVGDGDVAGTASPYSSVSMVSGSTGVFKIFVSKSAAGAETYQLDYHCLYGATPHPTPGPLQYLQNQ